MVNGGELVNLSDVTSGLWQSMQPTVSPLVTIFKAVGIAILVYVIFLIIRALFRWRTMNKVSKIAKDVSQINEKLDVLIGKKFKQEEHKEESFLKKKPQKEKESEKKKEKKSKK